MNPKKFGKLANHKQEPWKEPLPEFIESLYRKRFKKDRPESVRSVEQMVKEKERKQAERKVRKQQEQDRQQSPVKTVTATLFCCRRWIISVSSQIDEEQTEYNRCQAQYPECAAGDLMHLQGISLGGAMLENQLQKYFGFDSFKKGQKEVIDRIMKGQSAAAIFPTGAGKSLCYQLPAVLLPGMTTEIHIF